MIIIVKIVHYAGTTSKNTNNVHETLVWSKWEGDVRGLIKNVNGIKVGRVTLYALQWPVTLVSVIVYRRAFVHTVLGPHCNL